MQCNTEAELNTAQDNIDELLHGPAWCLPRRWCRSASGRTIFVSILWRALADHTQWTPKSTTTRKWLQKFGICQTHVSRCQIVSRVVVSARSTSASTLCLESDRPDGPPRSPERSRARVRSSSSQRCRRRSQDMRESRELRNTQE